MPYFPAGFFAPNQPIAGDTLDWTFERVLPDAICGRVRVPASSTEWHVFRLTAERANGSTLTAAQISDVGVDAGFALRQPNGKFADPVWFLLQSDAAQNAALPFAVDGKFFRALIGPDAQNSLGVGTYQTTLRARTSPHTVKRLANLEVT